MRIEVTERKEKYKNMEFYKKIGRKAKEAETKTRILYSHPLNQGDWFVKQV